MCKNSLRVEEVNQFPFIKSLTILRNVFDVFFEGTQQWRISPLQSENGLVTAGSSLTSRDKNDYAKVRQATLGSAFLKAKRVFDLLSKKRPLAGKL